MQLSQEQQAAALTESKNALCLAGAGSGKTRTLVQRVRYLIEEKNVSPYECLLCTFTRKSAGEMRERLEKSIGNKAFNVTIGTLHSVALNYIQRFGEFIGLNPGKITVYSQWEEGILLKDVCKELGYHNGKTFRKVKKKDIDEAFHLFYTRKRRNDHMYTENEIMDAFFQRCKENNALTYGMIMTAFLDLIPRIGHMLKFKHVIIDETQDNDPLQWRIVRLICSVCDASLFVVGDPNQAIFSFRGADPEYLIRNQEKFDIYKLKDNYRSDAYIVDAANSLIRHNKNRLDLEMNPIRGHKNPLWDHQGMDSERLVQNIKNIPDLHPAGSLEKVAVLGRNHFLLEKLSTLLTESGIDHEYIGKKTAFTRSEEFRRVHAFLVLAVNPFDNFSFMLCREYLEVDTPLYKQIRMIAVQQDKSHFQVFQEMKQPEWITEYLEAIDKESFHDVVESVMMVDFDFQSFEVFEFIQNYQSANHQPTIAQYLEYVTLYDVQDELTEDPCKLQLMTIHASKGLEWSMVIIAGLNEGILPSYRAKNSQSELESERRLAYVAYTRAQDFLILTSRPVDPEAKIPQPVSRFIKESF